MHHQGTWSYRPSHHRVGVYWRSWPQPMPRSRSPLSTSNSFKFTSTYNHMRTIFSARTESAMIHGPFVAFAVRHVPLQGPTHRPSRLHVGSMQEVLHVRVPGRVQGVTSQKSAKKNQLDAPFCHVKNPVFFSQLPTKRNRKHPLWQTFT